MNNRAQKAALDKFLQSIVACGAAALKLALSYLGPVPPAEAAAVEQAEQTEHSTAAIKRSGTSSLSLKVADFELIRFAIFFILFARSTHASCAERRVC
jgi:hypothetical protein